jgi:hypothetical protein
MPDYLFDQLFLLVVPFLFLGRLYREAFDRVVISPLPLSHINSLIIIIKKKKNMWDLCYFLISYSDASGWSNLYMVLCVYDHAGICK